MTVRNYKEIISKYQEDIISSLQRLLSFKSVEQKADKDHPFGDEIHLAFTHMLNRGETEGFNVENVDNYGGHIEFHGHQYDDNGEIISSAEKTLGIPVHLDIVPVGNDWDYDPYGKDIVDGYIYGRGTTDDKGATIACYYAMKALKEAGFKPRKNIRLILGLDEETNWEGMKYYMDRVDPPDFGFAPDADFPVINGEMGIIVFEIAKKLRKTNEKGIMLRSISGGHAANMVADGARAVIMADSYDIIKERIKEFCEETGYKINGKGIGKAFEITTTGKSSHGARPEDGVNAISVLFMFLEKVGFANESVRELIDFYQKHIGFEHNGSSLGIGLRDEPSGDLILNVGTVEVDSEAAIFTINVRYPVTKTQDDVYDNLKPVLDKYNLGLVKGNHKEPIYYPTDDPFIQTLMKVYVDNTGDTKAKPEVIGGGTFARAIPGGVAFGCRFPDKPDIAHKKNERLAIDDLMKMTRIYADAIYELTKD